MEASIQMTHLTHQNHEPGSEGYKAVKDYHSRISAIREETRLRLFERNEDQDRLKRGPRPFEEYDTIVHHAIKKMTLLTNKIVDPKMSDSEKDMNGYRWACRSGDLAPKPILEYMKLRLVTECGGWSSFTAGHVKHIAEHRLALKEIFRRFEVTNQPIPDPSLYLRKFMDSQGLLDEDNLKDMDVFKSWFPTYERAIVAFFDELGGRDDWNKGDRCYLLELITRSSFNYSRIGSFVKELKDQLKDLEFISENCAKAMYSGSSYIEERANETSKMTDLIQTNSTKWLNEYLAAAWPSIHNQIFQDQLRDVVKQPGQFDREMLKNVSDLTNSILKETGTPNYTYDMLIVRAPKTNFQFYFDDLPINSYYNEGGDFGLDTVLVRRPLNNTKNVEKVALEDLRTNITYAMKDLYDTKYVKEVAEGLKNKLGSFVSENGFQGFAIARKWEKNIFKSCSAIDDVQYSKDSFNTIYNFTYQNSGSILQHCETFNFYFFL